jgi:hypothetical protein
MMSSRRRPHAISEEEFDVGGVCFIYFVNLPPLLMTQTASFFDHHSSLFLSRRGGG